MTINFMMSYRELLARHKAAGNMEAAKEVQELIDEFQNFYEQVERFATQYGTIALEETIAIFYHDNNIKREIERL